MSAYARVCVCMSLQSCLLYLNIWDCLRDVFITFRQKRQSGENMEEWPDGRAYITKFVGSSPLTTNTYGLVEYYVCKD